jgi:hypothetical protein
LESILGLLKSLTIRALREEGDVGLEYYDRIKTVDLVMDFLYEKSHSTP